MSNGQGGAGGACNCHICARQAAGSGWRGIDGRGGSGYYEIDPILLGGGDGSFLRQTIMGPMFTGRLHIGDIPEETISAQWASWKHRRLPLTREDVAMIMRAGVDAVGVMITNPAKPAEPNGPTKEMIDERFGQPKPAQSPSPFDLNALRIEAVRLVSSGEARPSPAVLQRRLGIGYAQAEAFIIDMAHVRIIRPDEARPGMWELNR